jgi:hypothetical protein
MRATLGLRQRTVLLALAPSKAADEELFWFFNEAEAEVDQPSNFCAMLAGMSPDSLEAVERRAEALHSAGKIRTRLQAIPPGDARMLESLYRERAWPEAVEKALGVFTGPVEALPIVRAEYLRALVGARTRAKSVTAWLAELVAAKGEAPGIWLPEAELVCAMAIAAYERARGKGPSVVPEGFETEEDAS